VSELKGKEAPVIFTTVILDNSAFKDVTSKYMSKIVAFKAEFRASQQ
jgi:hypothetical protein